MSAQTAEVRDAPGPSARPGCPSVIRLGLPMGCTFALTPRTGQGSRVVLCSVRRGGMLVTLEEATYLVWLNARANVTAGELTVRLAKQLRRAVFAVGDDLSALREVGLLAELTGTDYDDDWEIIGSMRPVVVATTDGLCGDADRYAVRNPGTGRGLKLNVLAFSIWSFWDGRVSVAEAARQAQRDLHAPQATVRATSRDLVVEAHRLGLIHLDTRS